MNPFIQMLIDHDVNYYKIIKNLKNQKLINKLILLNIILICANITILKLKINNIEQSIALNNYNMKMKGSTKSEDEKQKGE